LNVPLVGTALPKVAYNAGTRVVTVVLHVMRGANLNHYFPYYLATPGHEPVRMTIEGPILAGAAARRFGTDLSDAEGDYWALTGTLPANVSFAVYYDEVWRGTDSVSNRPCSSVFRRLVTTKTEGAQLDNERGAAGLLPLVPLLQPISTETLMSIGVPRPSGLRAVASESAVGTRVHFRAAWFRPRQGSDVATNLDARRGFDVALTTGGPAPADLEYRYILGRSDNGEFVIERFAWSIGDAIAANQTIRTRGLPQPDGSCIVRLDAGYDRSITLHINASATGLIQIVNATR